MKNKFKKLWFSEKETDIYLYLVEYWISPASEIARALNIPKSTINFIADNLWKRLVLKKSFRWKTWYYEAEINNLEENILKEIEEKSKVISEILPYLKEKWKSIISKPKITFIDWLDSCINSYLEILKIKKDQNWIKKFYEFWAHEDLEKAFWKKFMQDFIDSRVKKQIFCKSIWSDWEVEKELKLKDNVQMRNLKLFPKNLWEIKSSIVMYENKVLILNLNAIFTGVLIENREFYETMKSIFNICVK